MQWSLTERLVRRRLQWAGLVERMADERLPKRVAELRQQGRRRRGRSMLRWEDCVKRDVWKTGEDEDWNKKKRDRGGWKRLSDEAVKKLRAARHPRQRETRKLVLDPGNICIDTIFMIIIMHSFPDIEENFILTMAVFICIHIICILYYNILCDSMIILDNGNIYVDTTFMILSCIVFQILTKLGFSIMAVLICIHIYAYS